MFRQKKLSPEQRADDKTILGHHAEWDIPFVSLAMLGTTAIGVIIIVVMCIRYFMYGVEP
jgi:hypothetical protein